MKRGILVVLAMLLAASAAWNVPIFAWSGSSYFAGVNQQITTTVSYDELQTVLDYATTGRAVPSESAFESVINTVEKKPAVVVLFLEPELRTDQIAQNSKGFATLKSMIESQSASSVVAPWVSLTSQDMVERKCDRIVMNTARAVIAAGGRVSLKANGDSLKNLLSSNMDVTLFSHASSLSVSDKTVELVIVQLTGAKDASDNDIIAEVVEAVKTASNGNYVAILTAENAADPGVQFAFKDESAEAPKRPEWMERYAIDAAVTGANCTANCTTIDDLEAYFPFWFWEGLIFGIIFVWIAVCGTCVLMQIQTPDRFLGEVAKKQQ